MLKISEITKQKKGKRFNIFVNGVFTVGVSQDTLAEFNLYKDKDFSNDLLLEIIKYDFHHGIMDKALRLISGSMKTEKILRLKLVQIIKERKADYSIDFNDEEMLNDIIKKLKEYGYLDDLRFAKEFVADRLNSRQRSKEMLKVELMTKGIPRDIINTVLEEIKIDENKSVEELLLKKYRSKRIEKGDNKKINFLRSKGYNWDVISKFISDDFEE